MKKGIPLLIALVTILFLWIFFSEEEPLTGKFYKAPLPEKFIKSSYYSEYNLENKFVIYVDFAKSAKKRRLWVVDKGEVIATSYTAHGKKSASFSSYLAPRRFSNVESSNQSSLGIYRIYPERNMNPGKKHTCRCENYTQSNMCEHKGRKFPINGLEESNNKAIDRGVVIHTARYVSEQGCTGNSDGCFTVSPEVFEILQKKRLLFLKKCYLVAIK
ncbi:MAG: hypothetical protein RL737_1237 [Bacteroidota bacterium]|jgi:hypothetical protein